MESAGGGTFEGSCRAVNDTLNSYGTEARIGQGTVDVYECHLFQRHRFWRPEEYWPAEGSEFELDRRLSKRSVS